MSHLFKRPLDVGNIASLFRPFYISHFVFFGFLWFSFFFLSRKWLAWLLDRLELSSAWICRLDIFLWNRWVLEMYILQVQSISFFFFCFSEAQAKQASKQASAVNVKVSAQGWLSCFDLGIEGKMCVKAKRYPKARWKGNVKAEWKKRCQGKKAK